jgi:hypothetical protein
VRFPALPPSVDEAGAIAVKKGIPVNIVQCCFVKCQAPHGIHIFLVTSQAKPAVTGCHNFVGENANSHTPTTFSLAGDFPGLSIFERLFQSRQRRDSEARGA